MCTKEEAEEAIKTLRGMKAENLDLGNLYTRDRYEALDMAIKEQEHCENDKIKEKILYELEHPDLQNEKRYGFEGGLMYAREVIEKYL